MKKYELVLNDKKEFLGKTLYRIRALVAIESMVSPGQLGGYIERESIFLRPMTMLGSMAMLRSMVMLRLREHFII